MPKEVQVTVGADGSTTLDFSGFVGKDCLLTSDKLRKALADLGLTLDDTNFIAKPELGLAGLVETDMHSQHQVKQGQGQSQGR
jgi:hypothetical protein